MAQFMMLYKGEATDVSDMTEEQAAAVMAGREAWMGRVGPSLADVGAPFAPGASVVDDGSSPPAMGLTGYSIVEADGLEAAKALADGHPYLSEGKGDYAIDIYELTPIPFQD